MAIARDYAPRGVATVAICANDAVSHPGDSFEAMAERASEQGYAFPYARDDSQEVPRAYGAERTPEVFVLDGERRRRVPRRDRRQHRPGRGDVAPPARRARRGAGGARAGDRRDPAGRLHDQVEAVRPGRGLRRRG